MQFNTLTLTLQNFIAALSGGYGRIQGSANSLLSILVGIEVVLLGLWTALSGGDNVVGIFKKILHIGAWVWIVQSYPTLCKAFVQSLVQAGLLAGGGGDVASSWIRRAWPDTASMRPSRSRESSPISG